MKKISRSVRYLQILPNELKKLHLEVLEEFNNSKYAKLSGISLSPSRLHLIEANKILERLPVGGTLLDVGCGNGIIPRLIHRLNFRVISVDFPVTGGEGALKRLMDLGIEGYYCQVGVDPLPIPDNSVDVVFVGNVIEHLPHTPKYFLDALKKVLKVGGSLIVDTKNAVDLKTRLKMLWGISNWPSIDGIYHKEFNPYHHKEYTLEELIKLFNMAGLQNISGYSFEVFFYKSLKKFRTWKVMGLPRSMWNEFGTGFNPMHPYEYLRLFLLLITWVFPNTRSDIMVIGQKF